jgi:signal transduction histidine kinase/DNA-binding response OmpR family regulator
LRFVRSLRTQGIILMEILIVEDDYVSRSMLKKMLVEMGHQVNEAENGTQAWKLLLDQPFSLVITDWLMPEMDGLELCRKIRSDLFSCYVYVIMLTSKDHKNDLVDVFQAGADDYIPKPFNPEELQARVLTAMRVVELERRHKQLNHTLIESRNKLRIVLDSLQEEIVSIDPAMNIVSVNKAFVDRVGCHPTDLVGKACFEPIEGCQTPLCPIDIKPLVSDMIASGEDKHLLLKSAGDQGGETYRQIDCLPIFDENRGLIQAVVVSKDITEDRRKAEEISSLNNQLLETASQIEAKNKKLKSTLKRLEDTQAQMVQSEKMASIGQLAAGVAHEINNPTGFVSSNLKTLSDYQKDLVQLIKKYQGLAANLSLNKDSGEPFVEYLAEINSIKAFENDIDIDFLIEDIDDLIGDCQEGTNRIKKIVLDLKDFAHPGEDVLQSMDINNGLESTLNVVNNELKYKATVHRNFGDIPAVKAYPQQLNQVFMNILVNAAQAIEKKGDIHITTRLEDDWVEIQISDNGCGIDPQNVSKIFDPFFTTKDVGKGTGLGMNIAYNIVKKHDGTIDVASEVGRGTTFTIRIPAEKETV